MCSLICNVTIPQFALSQIVFFKKRVYSLINSIFFFFKRSVLLKRLNHIHHTQGYLSVLLNTSMIHFLLPFGLSFLFACLDLCLDFFFLLYIRNPLYLKWQSAITKHCMQYGRLCVDWKHSRKKRKRGSSTKFLWVSSRYPNILECTVGCESPTLNSWKKEN